LRLTVVEWLFRKPSWGTAERLAVPFLRRDRNNGIAGFELTLYTNSEWRSLCKAGSKMNNTHAPNTSCRIKLWFFKSISLNVFLYLIGTLSIVGQGVHAEAFLPSDDHQVLEHVFTAGKTIDGELRRKRQLLSRNPQDLSLALFLAQRYVELGRKRGDLRFAGYAQAALAPWWNQSQPPTDVVLLRAILRQRQHDFTRALNDLSQVLEVQPYNAQAWLIRAVIQQVRGEYAQAIRSCLRLSRLVKSLVATSCSASVASLNGRAEISERVLQQSLSTGANADPEVRLWALTVLADIAARLGHDAVAEEHFTQALALSPQDNTVLSAYADFLLDRNRARKVVSLLESNTQSDALLLRLALAEKRLGMPHLEAHVQDLGVRFAAARLRKQGLHLSSEARFTLHLLNKPTEALRLAQQNWSIERTPADVRLVLETALSTGDLQAAAPVLDWLEQTGLEDISIQKLILRLEETRS
jgi:Flp pilus assembly protein TadD